MPANRRAGTTIAHAIEEYLQVAEVDAPAISGWFADLRRRPGSRGKARSERTIQTYARSARAFFHWLVHRELLQSNPFDRVVFPKVGRPLIQTIDAEEFERLLLACTPSNESGPIAERAAVRNRAILWVFYFARLRKRAGITGKRISAHMNDEDIQEQKRKYSPGDHLPTRMPGPRETRRRGYRARRLDQRRREK